MLLRHAVTDIVINDLKKRLWITFWERSQFSNK